MALAGSSNKLDHTVKPIRRSSDLIYLSPDLSLASDSDYGIVGVGGWTRLTNYMVSATISDGTFNATNNLLIEVSFNKGSTYTVIFNGNGSNNFLDTIMPVTNSTLRPKIRISLTGASLVDLGQEALEDVDGRLAEIPYKFDKSASGGMLLAFSGRSPISPNSIGIPGRILEFRDRDLQVSTATCITKEDGFWHVRLPYGNYEVYCGRSLLIKNLVVGTTSQVMSRRMTRVVNQEERSNIFSTFGDLDWARFCIFDTFEDATKVSSGSSSGIDSFIRYSRLWGDNTRWVERVALYIQAI